MESARTQPSGGGGRSGKNLCWFLAHSVGVLGSAVPLHKATAITSAYVLLVLLVEFQIRVEINAYTEVNVFVIKKDLLLNL